MMGTIASQNFQRIDEIISQVNDVGVQEFFQVRTYTHIVVNAAGRELPLQDRLPLSAELAEEEVIESYLTQDESEKLEFKGSAFVDIKPWALGGQKLTASEKCTNEGVLKAVVGLLNSKGGKVVVGVLEARQFERAEGEVAELLKGFPHYGRYIVPGVNLDYGTHDADWFQLRLQDIIKTRIQPTPSSWVSVRLHGFQGRDVCIISVSKVMSEDWFYLQYKESSVFYVRRGNSTEPLSGPQADEYKRSDPRTRE